jgi:hypothetical protein
VRLLLPALAVVVGALLAPAAAARAADTTPYHLTLAPAIVLIGADNHDPLSFTLINGGDSAVTIAASTTDSWLIPAEKSFSIPGHTRHNALASMTVPVGAATGDHETGMTFTAAPPPGGTGLQVALALRSRVIIDAGGALDGVMRFGLSVSRLSDSWDQPTVKVTLDNRLGNTHRVVSVGHFGEVLVLRGQDRVLTLPWRDHPFVGTSTFPLVGEEATTLFLPMRLGAGVLAVLAGLLLLLRARRRSKQ